MVKKQLRAGDVVKVKAIVGGMDKDGCRLYLPKTYHTWDEVESEPEPDSPPPSEPGSGPGGHP